jgi:hypothetical protein
MQDRLDFVECRIDLEGASSTTECWEQATILTPQQAHERRVRMIDEAAAARQAVKGFRRARAREQEKGGLRPRRSRAGRATVSFATVNITAVDRLREEIQRDGELAEVDYIAIQELGLHGEAVGDAEAWIKKARWSGVLDAAYKKHAGFGGGTGIVSRHPAGIRRIGTVRRLLRGRLSMGCTVIGVPVVNASFYGISGAPLSAQLPLWRELADELISLGRPFIVAADWQRPPADLRASGLCELLDAQVCAPPCATNLNSGGKLDYFLVSNTLLVRGWKVKPIHGCGFRPHIPVVLELQMSRCCTSTSRLWQPRLLPFEKPDSTHAPGAVVDWSAWSALPPGAASDDVGNLPALTKAAEHWYAGAEAELLTAYSKFGQADEVEYLGIGLPPRVVVESAPTRFASTSDALGLLGHRQ